MSNLNKKWSQDYKGFESIMDFDEDWEEVLIAVTPNGEYLGTVRITFEYIPTEEEMEDE